MTLSKTTSNNIVEQLSYLKRITNLTGVLHEAQIQHIKLYWGLLSDGSGKIFKIDFDNKIIEFILPENGNIDRNMVKPFYDAMTFLLGQEWAYRFVQNDTEISV